MKFTSVKEIKQEKKQTKLLDFKVFLINLVDIKNALDDSTEIEFLWNNNNEEVMEVLIKDGKVRD
jgi:hypothetical protein